MGCSKISYKREIYSNTIFLKKQEDQIENLTLHLKKLGKKEQQQQQQQQQQTSKISRRKEIIKM